MAYVDLCSAASVHAQHGRLGGWCEVCITYVGLLQVINDLFKPDKREGELERFLKQAEHMAKEADGLQCNVTRDLEKLKASPAMTFQPVHAQQGAVPVMASVSLNSVARGLALECR